MKPNHKREMLPMWFAFLATSLLLFYAARRFWFHRIGFFFPGYPKKLLEEGPDYKTIFLLWEAIRVKTLFLYGQAEDYTNYVNAFEQLGAKVLATTDEYRAAECDGLLLPGGGDVRSTLYGQECNGSHEPNDQRDNGEFHVIARFLALDRPILGICRGMQILNIVFGGTLHQDISGHSQVNNKDHVHLSHTDDPLLCRLYGEQFPINSAHHQAVDQLGVGLKAIQWSEDGYIEALCHEIRPFWAVQWHPERTCFAHSRPDTVDGSKYLNAFLQLL